MNDNIQRRSAHVRRHHVHDTNPRVVVAAWAFVVVTSVAVARSLQKRAKFRAPSASEGVTIASEWGHHIFRRKFRMYLSTVTMINLLRRRKHNGTEFRLGISFPNFEPRIFRVYAQTVLL